MITYWLNHTMFTMEVMGSNFPKTQDFLENKFPELQGMNWNQAYRNTYDKNLLSELTWDIACYA